MSHKGHRPELAETLEHFLLALAESGDVEFAAQTAGVHPSIVQRIKRENSHFALGWEDALRQHAAESQE